MRPRPSSTPDLFSQTLADWMAEPRAAFDAWLSAEGFNAASAAVYRAQWLHFLDWLGERGQALVEVRPELVNEFLRTLDINREQRARYLRIVERVFDELRRRALGPGNPARSVARQRDADWSAAKSNAPTGFLTVDERVRLARSYQIDVVRSPSAFANGGSVDEGLVKWRRARDGTLACLFLGRGLKLGEVTALTVSCVLDDGRRLNLRRDGGRRAREVVLDLRVAAVLTHWLEIRSQVGPAGTLLFPSTLAGNPMHKATVLRAIDALVIEAGIAQRDERISPQTLRNSFAAGLFERGLDDAQVADQLGFTQSISATRLHAAWKAWQQRLNPPCPLAPPSNLP